MTLNKIIIAFDELWRIHLYWIARPLGYDSGMMLRHLLFYLNHLSLFNRQAKYTVGNSP